MDAGASEASDLGSAVAIPPWLVDQLGRRAEPGRFLPFDVLIDAVLYDPQGGYYASAPSPLGPEGDFYTAPQVDPMFGSALARRILAEFDRLGRPDDFVVAELGPGDGTLARDVAAALDGLEAPRGWPYYLIDRSVSLREVALARVRAEAPRGVVKVEATSSLGNLGPIRGLVFSNELLDALPFRRFRRRGEGWEELGVRLAGDSLVPVADPRTPRVPTSGLPASAEEGTILELNTVAEALVREVADHLGNGSALFVDFGAEETELVRTRPRGTWTAFAEHRVVNDPLAALATADQSVFVNFSRLRAAAKQAGLVERSFRPQREALVDWGLEGAKLDATSNAESEEEKVRLHLASKQLLFGFEQFWAWELHPPERGPLRA
ncbi:MAG: SAM-dependent methyltransferase [Thermoplasmata archaeon]|nr:SAM-dependent methyltransferase [Thermoplasmata archaeon]